MAERIHPAPEWYQRKVLSLSDRDDPIGPPAFAAEATVALETALAFGALVRLERRNAKMTVASLAAALDVEETEIRGIEHDPAYRARPRTIVGIAQHFKLPTKEVMKLAGAAASNDEQFKEQALRFAAHSDDMGGLSDDEKQLLRSFVEFLRERSSTR